MKDLASIPAFNLNWNPITVEAYNEEKNEATMIFNLDVTTEGKVKHVIHYVVGRTIWCHRNVPANAHIILSFDFRGQGIIVSRASKFKQEILELLANLNINNHISIDFLL
ncbi:hypothetical protein [Mucilaginibacter flavidus]|uniref:hypothetical protein n=1 Tax=Mucilaginibacter flavidus TaxID=2949309 RepID=UPI002092392B|nr:hypothetical protein [Mucilaginibacter flavidus]MCO5950095.1 hypothetical protein [Mucilaginibacter flavidus]